MDRLRTRRLRIVGRATPQKAARQARRLPQSMTHGDVLYRLSLISPDDYKALETMARIRLKELWPYETDILDLNVLRKA